MNTTKTFENDFYTMIDRSEVNLKGLTYEVYFDNQWLLRILADRVSVAAILGEHLAQWAYNADDCQYVVFGEDDFIYAAEDNGYCPIDLHRRELATATLSTEHPRSEGMHSDIKAKTPTCVLEALAANGFKDCSWGNDETPSYYIPSLDSSMIYTHDDVGDDGQILSDKISFAVFIDSEFVETYQDIDTAIERAKQ